jgi:hypothetical protein
LQEYGKWFFLINQSVATDLALEMDLQVSPFLTMYFSASQVGVEVWVVVVLPDLEVAFVVVVEGIV